MSGWWERFGGRLAYELEEFRARGLDFAMDEALLARAGRVLLRGSVEDEGERVELEVLYPDLFPYMRPEVYAPGLALERHQNPATRNLCLLDRSTRSWRPEDTGAWLVAERVPYLLSLFRAGPEAMVDAEVAQGEPASTYYPVTPGTVVFVPAAALKLDPALEVGSGRLIFSADWPPQIGLRALLGELVARRPGEKKTELLARADEPLRGHFAAGHIQMRWARLQGPPPGFDADALLAAAEAVQPGFGNPPWQAVRDGEVAVTGVVFPEEVRQGVLEDAWLFAMRWRQAPNGKPREGAFLIRGERLTSEDLATRIPKLAALREARVAQVGLGALGAPLALELARNQVGTLRLLEHDLVEAAQIVRWPFGLPTVGRYKLEMVASSIEQNYPYTRVERFAHRLGQTATERKGRGENELDLLDRFMNGASLVLDASTEVGVQQLLSDFARAQRLKQVYLSATEGARGGQVVAIVPGAGGCWFCWKKWAEEGSIPLPPSGADGSVQPRGCSAPTFTGASFDLLPIAAQAARVAAAVLRHETEQASTVWVCELPEDGIAPPQWQAHPIEVHPDCPYCQ